MPTKAIDGLDHLCATTPKDVHLVPIFDFTKDYERRLVDRVWLDQVFHRINEVISLLVDTLWLSMPLVLFIYFFLNHICKVSQEVILVDEKGISKTIRPFAVSSLHALNDLVIFFKDK